MSIPSIIVMTPLLLSSFRCFPYGPRVSPQASSRRGLLFPRQLEREREREDPTTLSRQIPARIIGYERFRSAAHKFHVDRISGGSSTLGGGGGQRESRQRANRYPRRAAISRIWVKLGDSLNQGSNESTENRPFRRSYLKIALLPHTRTFRNRPCSYAEKYNKNARESYSRGFARIFESRNGGGTKWSVQKLRENSSLNIIVRNA